MDTTQLRKLAWKSQLKFGKHHMLSVQQVLTLDRTYLYWVYYNCSNISFLDEVMLTLNLTGDWVIPKPGIKPEMHQLKLDDMFNRMSIASLNKMHTHTENKLDSVDSETLLPKSFTPKPEQRKTAGEEQWLSRTLANPSLNFRERKKTFNPVLLKKSLNNIENKIIEKKKFFATQNKIKINFIPNLTTGHHVLETLQIMTEIQTASSKNHIFNGKLYGSGVQLIGKTRSFFLAAALESGLFETTINQMTKETVWNWTGTTPTQQHVETMVQWFSNRYGQKLKINVPVYLFGENKKELMAFINKQEAADYFKVTINTLNTYIRKELLIQNKYYIHTNQYQFIF